MTLDFVVIFGTILLNKSTILYMYTMRKNKGNCVMEIHWSETAQPKDTCIDGFAMLKLTPSSEPGKVVW